VGKARRPGADIISGMRAKDRASRCPSNLTLNCSDTSRSNQRRLRNNTAPLGTLRACVVTKYEVAAVVMTYTTAGAYVTTPRTTLATSYAKQCVRLLRAFERAPRAQRMLVSQVAIVGAATTTPAPKIALRARDARKHAHAVRAHVKVKPIGNPRMRSLTRWA